MSTETINKKIKIDNGTTFGKTYTDKAVDERLQGLVSTATFTPVKEKANNSLQKPAGLTKTKLVGVGANGQENIEIGDNLALTNGKLSAIGGSGSGSGEAAFDILTLSSDTSYTGIITGTKPILLNVRDVVLQLPNQTVINDDNSFGVQTSDLNPDGTITTTQLSDGTISSSSVPLYYYHFITLTNDHDFLYLQYFNPHDDKINSDGGMPFSIETLKTALSGKKVVCTGVLGNSNETLATPLYVSGEAGGLEVYYVLKNDTSGTITSKSIAAFTISDVVKPIE